MLLVICYNNKQETRSSANVEFMVHIQRKGNTNFIRDEAIVQEEVMVALLE